MRVVNPSPAEGRDGISEGLRPPGGPRAPAGSLVRRETPREPGTMYLAGGPLARCPPDPQIWPRGSGPGRQVRCLRSGPGPDPPCQVDKIGPDLNARSRPRTCVIDMIRRTRPDLVCARTARSAGPCQIRCARSGGPRQIRQTTASRKRRAHASVRCRSGCGSGRLSPGLPAAAGAVGAGPPSRAQEDPVPPRRYARPRTRPGFCRVCSSTSSVRPSA